MNGWSQPDDGAIDDNRMADEDIVDAAEKAAGGVAAAVKDGADSIGKAAMEGAKGVALAAKDRVSLGGVEVSPLGVGAWSWGDTAFWGYSEAMDKELQEVGVVWSCVGRDCSARARRHGFDARGSAGVFLSLFNRVSKAARATLLCAELRLYLNLATNASNSMQPRR